MPLLLALPLALAVLAPDSIARTSSVRGTVLDASRAPIADARVEASRGGAAISSTRTDAHGEFTLALPAGEYTVRAAAPGFREAAAPVTALAGKGVSQEFVLEVAPFRDAVTVEAVPGYQVGAVVSATRTLTPLSDVPQSVTVVARPLIRDQLMGGIGDVVRYVPGITAHQGENNRDQVVIRGNNSSADFFLDGVRDDVQYYRDLYNLDRVEALKGPNAMIFGRGGGGGVVNRVTKEAEFRSLREVSVQGGRFGHKRAAADVDVPLGRWVAFRFNGMYEDSGSFRDQVSLERSGLNPTLTIAPSASTKVTLGYEHFQDTRVADRGIPSFQGLPVDVDSSLYFGDPAQSHVRARVNLGWAGFEHRAGRFSVRNRTLFGDYDRFYQNFVPGVVNAEGTRAALSAYNNDTARQNLFNQTDVIFVASTGRARHTLLAGVEVGRQLTDNFRNTGYFANTATSISVPLAAPTVAAPVTFRQGATDADNHVRTSVAAAYAQDEVEVSRRLRLVGGLRFDRFDLRYINHRTGDVLARPDDLVSPRAGVVFKPMLPLSLYGSYTVSYLPSSGDQFSSLTAVTQQAEPERFDNYEVGAKWDARPELSLTAAAYRLDRTNTRATDPNDPTRLVQTGAQRTDGVELGASGRVLSWWRVAGGYAFQDARVTSATTAARAGARVAQVPRHTFSLWNALQVTPRLGLGLGVLQRTDMFAAIDDTVVLPGYTRVDAAAYVGLTARTRLQANVENLFDRRYYVNADNNTNISPGWRRTVRIALFSRF